MGEVCVHMACYIITIITLLYSCSFKASIHGVNFLPATQMNTSKSLVNFLPDLNQQEDA